MIDTAEAGETGQAQVSTGKTGESGTIPRPHRENRKCREIIKRRLDRPRSQQEERERERERERRISGGGDLVGVSFRVYLLNGAGGGLFIGC